MSTFRPELVRLYRIAAGLSVEQVAVAIDRTAFTVSAYERGEISPPLEKLQQMADAVGIDVRDYFDVPVAS